MAEIDLIPSDYRRSTQLRTWLRNFALVYVGLLVVAGIARGGLAYGVWVKNIEVERLSAARQIELAQEVQLKALREEKAQSVQRMGILASLRGGVAAKEMFEVVDRALDRDVWFLDWKFRRAGELVEADPEAVHTGYFIVLPREKKQEGERAWLMRTHMEIRAQAVDHSALARFVRTLVDQPEIEEVRVLKTRMHRYTVGEVVDFELALVVKTQA